MTGMTLTLRDVVLSYGGAPVVDGLDLDVAPGEILVLTAGAIGDGGRHQPWLLRGVQTRGNVPGDCSRDPGVGVQWQVRTMLFSGTEWNDY